MNFSWWLNSMRLTVGILFVVLASKCGTLALAQDVGQLALSESAQVPDQQQTTAPPIVNYWDDCLDGCCRPTWNCGRPFSGDPCSSVYGQVQALFLVRDSGFSNQAIVVDAFPGPATTFLSTSALDSSIFTPGVQATFGMPLGCGRAVEFEYFGLFPQDGSAAVADPVGGLVFPGDTGGNVFLNMTGVQTDYSSWINGFAVNFPCCCGCCEECCDGSGCCQVGDGSGNRVVGTQSLTWFAGFRYFNIGEKLNIAADGVVPGEQGNYNVRTTNNLYGAQLGARIRRTRGRFGWDATGQAGIFGNDAQQSQFVQDFPAGPGSVLRNVSTSRDGVAFVGQGNLSGLYALTNVWNLRAGYNVIWIAGLALAPDQLDYNFATAGSGTRVNNDGSMFLHGVNVGLEARW